MTGIAKIRCTAQKFAHLIARRKIDLKQIFDCVASVCDTDFYVIAACHGLPGAATRTRQAPPLTSSVVHDRAAFFGAPGTGALLEVQVLP